MASVFFFLKEEKGTCRDKDFNVLRLQRQHVEMTKTTRCVLAHNIKLSHFAAKRTCEVYGSYWLLAF